MKAISPLIGFAITIFLVSIATIIALTVVKPVFDRVKDSITVNEGMQNLELIDSALKQVASESEGSKRSLEGSKRTVSLSVSDGEFKLNTAEDYIYFDYNTKTDYSLEGIIGNVRLDKSPVFIEYFNNYLENSNASPPWIIKNGTWTITSGEYSGQNGLAYYNYGNLNYFSLEGRITNKAGNGEIFALPVSPINLMGYWTFDEGSGNYTYDYSGFNNTGTLHDSIIVICSNGDCPIWITGKFDYALQFDGINDYVDVENSNSLNLTNEITIEAWVKS